MKIPGRAPEIRKEKVSLLDLAPTLCDLVGAGKPDAFKGKNLLDSPTVPLFHQTCERKVLGGHEILDIHEIEYCKVACQFDRFKYIFDYGKKKEELYDLARDPVEQNDISVASTKEVLQARALLKRFEEENPYFVWRK